MRKRKTLPEERERERRVIGYVTRVEKLGDTLRGRVSIEIDAIDADISGVNLDRALEEPSVLKPFSIIRIVTTERKLFDLFGSVLSEGAWVELEVSMRHLFPGPVTLFSQLQEQGYLKHRRVTILRANYLLDSGEPPPKIKSLSAAASSSRQMAANLVKKCNFPTDAIGPEYRVRAILRTLRTAHSIVIRDVGQASFSSILSKEGVILSHFDAGWPISFNMRTAPTNAPSMSGPAPVILSHWDWDHLHAYYKCPSLRSVRWLTPTQTLGPGAQKIARQLYNANLLIGYNGPEIKFRTGVLVSCHGSGPNNSGIALVLRLNSGKLALMIGDADYQEMGTQWAHTKFDLLSITHHGAHFLGQPPKVAGGSGRSVISVGKNNVYQHPKSSSMHQHVRAGWSIDMTSGTQSRSRYDKQLGP